MKPINDNTIPPRIRMAKTLWGGAERDEILGGLFSDFSDKVRATIAEARYLEARPLSPVRLRANAGPPSIISTNSSLKNDSLPAWAVDHAKRYVVRAAIPGGILVKSPGGGLDLFNYPIWWFNAPKALGEFRLASMMIEQIISSSMRMAAMGAPVKDLDVESLLFYRGVLGAYAPAAMTLAREEGIPSSQVPLSTPAVLNPEALWVPLLVPQDLGAAKVILSDGLENLSLMRDHVDQIYAQVQAHIQGARKEILESGKQDEICAPLNRAQEQRELILSQSHSTRNTVIAAGGATIAGVLLYQWWRK